jgi:hypothetical protein
VATAAFSTVSTTVSRTSPHHRSRDQRHDNHNKDKRLSDRGPRNAEKALARLIAVLDTQDVARAIDRLEKGHGAARGGNKVPQSLEWIRPHPNSRMGNTGISDYSGRQFRRFVAFIKLRTLMKTPDQDILILIRAIEDARRILREFIEPGPSDPMRTVERLLILLDRNDVVHALDRTKRRRVIRLVEIEQKPESQ